ncbi:MAG: AAA family ATPase [Cyanobacteria bacterium J06641_5]
MFGSKIAPLLSEQRQLIQNIQGQLGLTPEEAIDALALSADQQYQGLIQSLFEVNQQIALEQARFKADSPVVTSLVARRDQLVPLQEERAVELIGARAASNPSLLAIQDETRVSLAQSLIQASSQIDLLESREQSLRLRIAQLEVRIEDFPEVTRRFNDISDRLTSIRSSLDNLSAEQQRASVIAVENDVPWELVAPPFVTGGSSSAKKLLAAGVVGGFMLGAGLALALDRLQNVSFDDEDVASVSELLATIPDYEGERPLLSWMSQNPHTLERAKETDPNFFEFLEAFNSLYARLLLDTADRVPLRSLGVSAAGSGDGKTTVAVYLAYAMASAGKNVLLVDANLRSPCLHERLGLQNEQGLKQLLDNPGQALKQKSLLQPLPASKNLRVLTAGGVAANASQLLASEGMSTLMQKFRDKFDFVIYDCSRLQGYADAQYIADRTDGLLVVTQLQRSKRTDFQEALEVLKAVRLTTLGTIANAARPKRNRGYISGGLESDGNSGDSLVIDDSGSDYGLRANEVEVPSELREVEETFSEIRRRDRDETLS